MIATVFGKMIVMPIIGMMSTWILQRYYIDFPDGDYEIFCFAVYNDMSASSHVICITFFSEIDATCYLVMMIVFITPTANNVMVMVELSGSSSKVTDLFIVNFYLFKIISIPQDCFI